MSENAQKRHIGEIAKENNIEKFGNSTKYELLMFFLSTVNILHLKFHS